MPPRRLFHRSLVTPLPDGVSPPSGGPPVPVRRVSPPRDAGVLAVKFAQPLHRADRL
jgi:hypothetical protein